MHACECLPQEHSDLDPQRLSLGGMSPCLRPAEDVHKGKDVHAEACHSHQ